jgi:hypothetical protein
LSSADEYRKEDNMSYTINKQWSNPNVPKADGLWTFQRVMRDAIGRPCDYCGAHTKYLHEMLHPSILPVLVGCTCHAQLLGIPYEDAEVYQTQFMKEEKIRKRLEAQKQKEDEHDLIVINGGVCPDGLWCPRCKARLAIERKNAKAAADAQASELQAIKAAKANEMRAVEQQKMKASDDAWRAIREERQKNYNAVLEEEEKVWWKNKQIANEWGVRWNQAWTAKLSLWDAEETRDAQAISKAKEERERLLNLRNEAEAAQRTVDKIDETRRRRHV